MNTLTHRWIALGLYLKSLLRRLTRIYTFSCINLRVTTNDYRAALQAAAKEYEDSARAPKIDERLTQLAQTIGTLSRLIGLTPTVPLSITDAVRLAMRAGVP